MLRVRRDTRLAVIPGYGGDCDMCTPNVHYLLECACGYEWDEPPCPGVFECPQCGAEAGVDRTEHEAWLVVIGAK